MALTDVGSTNGSAIGTGTLTYPAGIASGDTSVLIIDAFSSTATAPSCPGYTLLANDGIIAILSKTLTGTETTDTITTDASANTRWANQVVRPSSSSKVASVSWAYSGVSLRTGTFTYASGLSPVTGDICIGALTNNAGSTYTSSTIDDGTTSGGMTFTGAATYVVSGAVKIQKAVASTGTLSGSLSLYVTISASANTELVMAILTEINAPSFDPMGSLGFFGI